MQSLSRPYYPASPPSVGLCSWPGAETWARASHSAGRPGSPHLAFQTHESSHRVEVMAILGTLMIWWRQGIGWNDFCATSEARTSGRRTVYAGLVLSWCSTAWRASGLMVLEHPPYLAPRCRWLRSLRVPRWGPAWCARCSPGSLPGDLVICLSRRRGNTSLRMVAVEMASHADYPCASAMLKICPAKEGLEARRKTLWISGTTLWRIRPDLISEHRTP